MMTKNKTNIIIITIVCVISVLFFLQGSSYRDPYQLVFSQNLQFTSSVQGSYEVEDSSTLYLLRGSDGEIKVSRNATNQKNLDLYLKESDGRKTTMSIKGIKTVEAERENWLIREEVYESEVDTYFVGYLYTNNWVYSISTISPALYDEVEQIARSFKYTGK